MSGRRNLTQIPSDVEYYPMEHVCNLLRVIAAERDELYVALQHEQAKATANAVYPTHQQHQHQQQPPHPPPLHHTQQLAQATATLEFPLFAEPGETAAAAPSTSSGVPSTFKVDAVKKRIAKKSYALVKKTPHSKARKPYTELNEAVPNAACALALFEGWPPKSDTNRLTRWELTGDQVVQWLHGSTASQHRYIHPVKFDGRVVAWGGMGKSFVYAWAVYQSLQAKFDKKGASLSLKFRTIMAGSGRPEEGEDSPPSLS